MCLKAVYGLEEKKKFLVIDNIRFCIKVYENLTFIGNFCCATIFAFVVEKKNKLCYKIFYHVIVKTKK